MEAIFPQLFLALLFQASFTTELTLQEVHIFWTEHRQDQLTPIRCSIPFLSSLPTTRSQARVGAKHFSLCRSAVQSLKVLLCSMGFESQVLAIEAQGGWDTLLSSQTHLMGVRIIAR